MAETAERTPRTPKKTGRERFLEAIARTGNVKAACEAAKIGRRTAYDWRGADPEFAEAWDAAMEEAVDMLEAEGWRRAAKGVLKPVFQGGEKVGEIREYSDTLLIFLMKGHRPGRFRETVRQEHSGPDGKPIRVGLDLSHASDEDLETVERLYRSAAAPADPLRDPAGESET